ncbi:LIM domain kinase 1-like isoform X2 [Labeo rohita]|uniref:LIM domain kinase 1-like isoform X2 n=1 Tax=Labeo rohita TaxID=84645 RepID=A0A498LTF2_LABRO|nr:PDZ and LIM domain protein 5-like isoform X2 [Labeo rohita]RXN10893.1 LIM domain kinase 1-like isoform X2 [Labeo rohita]RXN35964.1 LIM domain kinase 1-like isoform X2 [Labeo rohita]
MSRVLVQCSDMSDLPAARQKVRALRGQMISCRNQRYRRVKGTTCCECGASLSHWYYEKDGRLFCKKDYWAKFGELCHGCSEPITTGLIMVSPIRQKPNLCRLSSPHSPAVHPSILRFLTAAPVTRFSDNSPFARLLLPYHT